MGNVNDRNAKDFTGEAILDQVFTAAFKEVDRSGQKVRSATLEPSYDGGAVTIRINFAPATGVKA